MNFENYVVVLKNSYRKWELHRFLAQSTIAPNMELGVKWEWYGGNTLRENPGPKTGEVPGTVTTWTFLNYIFFESNTIFRWWGDNNGGGGRGGRGDLLSQRAKVHLVNLLLFRPHNLYFLASSRNRVLISYFSIFSTFLAIFLGKFKNPLFRPVCF